MRLDAKCISPREIWQSVKWNSSMQHIIQVVILFTLEYMGWCLAYRETIFTLAYAIRKNKRRNRFTRQQNLFNDMLCIILFPNAISLCKWHKSYTNKQRSLMLSLKARMFYSDPVSWRHTNVRHPDPVLLLRHDAVARRCANGSAAITDRSVTASDRNKNTGPIIVTTFWRFFSCTRKSYWWTIDI